MHLSDQVFDNLEAFKERVEYVARDTDENDFIGAYTPDYSFYSDRLVEDAPGYNALVNAEWFENIAARCICNYKFFDRIFHHKSITILPCHIYELGYWYYLMYKSESVYLPFNRVASDILKGISFSRIPTDELDDNAQFLSEWAIADILLSIDARMACDVISRLGIEASHKAELKKYIIRKDRDNLIAYIIINAIDTSVLQIACAIIILQQQFEMVGNVNHISREETERLIKGILGNPDYELPPGIFNLYHCSLNNPGKLSIENLVSYVHTSEVLKVQMLQQIKHYSTNIDAVNELENILQDHPEVDDTRVKYEDVADGILLNPRFSILEDFKKRFVSEIPYPTSIGKEKGEKSCYCYNLPTSKWKEETIFYLYQVLVDKGFLAWDEETLFSFMYRMCRDYKPERSDPSPIVWNGKINTLWTIIYHFYGETTKMDNLTRLFFLKKDGATFSERDGGKNSTNSKDQQIKEILQDPAFAKS